MNDLDKGTWPERTAEMGSACSERDLEMMARMNTEGWSTLIPMTGLQSGYEEKCRQYFKLTNDKGSTFSHLRLNIFPDGGIARIRVFGHIQPKILTTNVVDLLSMLNGAECVSFSNAHFGHPKNMIKPKPGVNMGDGWETARRLDRPAILTTDAFNRLNVPGCEWAIFKIYSLGVIDRIVVDTNHFKGNFPDTIKVEGVNLKYGENLNEVVWFTILDSQKLGPHREHIFEIMNRGTVSHVRVTIAPDGGISRLRAFGKFVRL